MRFIKSLKDGEAFIYKYKDTYHVIKRFIQVKHLTQDPTCIEDPDELVILKSDIDNKQRHTSIDAELLIGFKSLDKDLNPITLCNFFNDLACRRLDSPNWCNRIIASIMNHEDLVASFATEEFLALAQQYAFDAFFKPTYYLCNEEAFKKFFTLPISSGYCGVITDETQRLEKFFQYDKVPSNLLTILKNQNILENFYQFLMYNVPESSKINHYLDELNNICLIDPALLVNSVHKHLNNSDPYINPNILPYIKTPAKNFLSVYYKALALVYPKTIVLINNEFDKKFPKMKGLIDTIILSHVRAIEYIKDEVDLGYTTKNMIAYVDKFGVTKTLIEKCTKYPTPFIDKKFIDYIAEASVSFLKYIPAQWYTSKALVELVMDGCYSVDVSKIPTDMLKREVKQRDVYFSYSLALNCIDYDSDIYKFINPMLLFSTSLDTLFFNISRLLKVTDDQFCDFLNFYGSPFIDTVLDRIPSLLTKQQLLKFFNSSPYAYGYYIENFIESIPFDTHRDLLKNQKFRKLFLAKFDTSIRNKKLLSLFNECKKCHP